MKIGLATTFFSKAAPVKVCSLVINDVHQEITAEHVLFRCFVTFLQFFDNGKHLYSDGHLFYLAAKQNNMT